jgi:hypothetical protein
MSLDGTTYEFGIYVGLNKISQESREVVKSFYPLAVSKKIDFKWQEYPDNIGKANCLNNLFVHAAGSTYVVTLDNDMRIKMPWGHLIEIASKTDFELMGFGSSNFWAHIPGKEGCPFIEVNGYKIYKPQGIAGGMMLFPYYFLERNKWTNMGGVYGRDDEQMCLKTKRKYVLEWPVDWLSHDVLGGCNPELLNYHKKKEVLFSKKVYVFQKGWDE